MFTEQELNTLIVFVEHGARTIAASNPLEKAGQALLVAESLIKKLQEKEVKDNVL